MTTVYCYDARGNITQQRQLQSGHSSSTAYTWSKADRLASVRYPDGTTLSYQRNVNGHITRIAMKTASGQNFTVVKGVGYQPFGPANRYTLGNGQTISRRYDANGRLSELHSQVLHLHLDRDTMGNIIAIHGNDGMESYRYDPLYRLVGVKNPAGKALEAYTYSLAGDRLSKTGSRQATGSCRYAPHSHRLAATGNMVRRLDASGTATGFSRAGLGYQLNYNARNRLASVQQGDRLLTP